MAMKSFEQLGFKHPDTIVLHKNGVTVLVPTDPNDKNGYCVEIPVQYSGHNLCFYMISEIDALDICKRYIDKH